MIQRRAPATIAPPFYHRGSTFVNPLFVFFLAVGQIFPGPPENRNLIMGPPDFQGLFFRVHPTALVYVVDAVGEPDSTVTAICLNRINGFSGGCDFDALCGNLPACFIGDWLAVFQGKAVVVFQLPYASDINHGFPLSNLTGQAGSLPASHMSIKCLFLNHHEDIVCKIPVAIGQAGNLIQGSNYTPHIGERLTNRIIPHFSFNPAGKRNPVKIVLYFFYCIVHEFPQICFHFFSPYMNLIFSFISDGVQNPVRILFSCGWGLLDELTEEHQTASIANHIVDKAVILFVLFLGQSFSPVAHNDISQNLATTLIQVQGSILDVRIRGSFKDAPEFLICDFNNSVINKLFLPVHFFLLYLLVCVAFVI